MVMLLGLARLQLPMSRLTQMHGKPVGTFLTMPVCRCFSQQGCNHRKQQHQQQQLQQQQPQQQQPHRGTHVFNLAQAKQAFEGKTENRSWGSWESWSATLGVAILVSLGSWCVAFYEGLWTPLLRDAQTPDDAAAGLQRTIFQCPVQTCDIAGSIARMLMDGWVVIIDSFIDEGELAAARQDVHSLASCAGKLQINPKAQEGHMEVRTDRVCYLRHSTQSQSPEPSHGGGLAHCHHLLRSVANEIEGGASTGCLAKGKHLLVPNWAQLAVYGPDGGFYTWHTDSLDFHPAYWLLGPLGIFLFIKWGAVRNRAITAILYLNEGGDWTAEMGGALHCRAPAATLDGAEVKQIPAGRDGCSQIWPVGGRLVLFDSKVVEHEVCPTRYERWALTVWIHSR